jgi:hypothetical protein
MRTACHLPPAACRLPQMGAPGQTPPALAPAIDPSMATRTASNTAVDHQSIAADAWVVPPPFRTFAVRSEEPRHADSARAPYDRVHLIRTGFLDQAARQGLVAQGQARMQVSEFSDIAYANVTLDELTTAAPGVCDLAGTIAAALLASGVLGDDISAYRRSVEARIDYLASYGAGFHNDVSRHWTGCLFWNLALELNDVEFVMPHAGVRLALAPGDLVVFDPAMAHGLCRPRDQGQAVADSFKAGERGHQIFLSGELALTDGQWAALGSPWQPVEMHAQRGALELVAAEFDERSGAIKRLRTLAQCLLRSTRYVDETVP